jgi:hypothetical protein
MGTGGAVGFAFTQAGAGKKAVQLVEKAGRMFLCTM